MESVKEETGSHDEEEDAEEEEMEEESDQSDGEEEKLGEEEGEQQPSSDDKKGVALATKILAGRNLLPEDSDSGNELRNIPLSPKALSKSQSDTESEHSRRSLAPSPTDSLVAYTASMTLDAPPDLSGHNEEQEPDLDSTARPGQAHTIKERVVSDIARQQARQGKHHTKRSARKIGRPKGSKAKQDARVKLDYGGGWD